MQAAAKAAKAAAIAALTRARSKSPSPTSQRTDEQGLQINSEVDKTFGIDEVKNELENLLRNNKFLQFNCLGTCKTHGDIEFALGTIYRETGKTNVETGEPVLEPFELPVFIRFKKDEPYKLLHTGDDNDEEIELPTDLELELFWEKDGQKVFEWNKFQWDVDNNWHFKEEQYKKPGMSKELNIVNLPDVLYLGLKSLPSPQASLIPTHPATSGGTPDKLYILGRMRKVTKEGRTSFITYKGTRMSLTQARKEEARLKKEKGKAASPRKQKQTETKSGKKQSSSRKPRAGASSKSSTKATASNKKPPTKKSTSKPASTRKSPSPSPKRKQPAASKKPSSKASKASKKK